MLETCLPTNVHVLPIYPSVYMAVLPVWPPLGKYVTVCQFHKFLLVHTITVCGSHYDIVISKLHLVEYHHVHKQTLLITHQDVVVQMHTIYSGTSHIHIFMC